MLTFWRYGYETTSIADLTSAMGITAPSIYAAYGDKKALFLEATRLYAGDLNTHQTAMNSAPTARDAAYDLLVSAATAFTGDTTPPGCLLASATASGSSASADVQAAVADIRRQIGNCLCARIQRDIVDGILPADADAKALSQMTIAVVQGLSVLARDGASRDDLLNIAEEAMKAWRPYT